MLSLASQTAPEFGASLHGHAAVQPEAKADRHIYTCRYNSYTPRRLGGCMGWV